MDVLTEFVTFARVIEEGGFTKAAARLAMSKSAVSKHVARLEDHLGARLLERTTRRVRPTEAGARLYERCQRILLELEAAELEAGALQTTPSGLLRVSVGVSLGQDRLAPALPALLERCPDLRVEMVLNDRFVDLVEEGYDVALRIGRLVDSSLIARRLMSVPLVTAAAPAYLLRYGRPAAPGDLSGHACLGYSYLDDGDTWTFNTPGGVLRQRFEPRLRANNGDALAATAAAGYGIVQMPQYILADHLRAGRLEQVLEGTPPRPVDLYVVYPPGRPPAAKVRAFIDHVVEVFTGSRS